MTPPRTTDQLRQALAALGTLLHETINEVETLDTNLIETAREAEATVRRQTDEHLLALEETERKSRAQVAEELEASVAAKVTDALDAAWVEFSTERESLIRDCEQRLAAAKGGWESERARLEADGELANHLMMEGNEELGRAQSAGEELTREVQRLRQLKEDWDAERSLLLAERDSANKAAAETKDEFFRMLSDTEEAAAIALDRQIATAVERVRAEGATEALRARQELEREWQAEREQLALEIERANQQLNAETKKSLTATFEKDKSVAVDRVRAEMSAERDGLRLEVERLTKAAAEWQSEQNKLTANAESLSRQLVESSEELRRLSTDNGKGAGTALGPAAVAAETLLAEIARVEEMLRRISDVIKNPGTELSLVIRKNVERTELESYIKGIRFSMFGR